LKMLALEMIHLESPPYLFTTFYTKTGR
jgi:hypothetical protein